VEFVVLSFISFTVQKDISHSLLHEMNFTDIGHVSSLLTEVLDGSEIEEI
jgi:hypothetical protein